MDGQWVAAERARFTADKPQQIGGYVVAAPTAFEPMLVRWCEPEDPDETKP